MDLNLDKTKNETNLNKEKTKPINSITSISRISVIIGLIISLFANVYMYHTYIINSQFSTDIVGNMIVSFLGYFACCFFILSAICNKNFVKWDRLLIIFVGIWIGLLTYVGATSNITAITDNKIYYSSSSALGKVVEYSFKDVNAITFSGYYDDDKNDYQLEMYLNIDNKYIEIASLHDNINNSTNPSIDDLKKIYTKIKTESPNVEIITNVRSGNNELTNNIKYILN